MVQTHSAVFSHVARLATSVAHHLLALGVGGDLCFFGRIILAFFVVVTLLLLLIRHLLCKINVHGHGPSVVLRVEGFRSSTIFTLFVVLEHGLVEMLARGHVQC